MLFAFEGGDAKCLIVWRRTQRPRRDVDLEVFSQVLCLGEVAPRQGSDITSSFKGYFVSFVLSLQFCFLFVEQLVITTQLFCD